MKKVIFVSLCFLIALGTSWANEPDYVVSDGQVYVLESLKISPIFGFRGINEEGRHRFKASDVERYKKNGAVFCKLPEYIDNKPTGREVFMEAVVAKNGLTVYRYPVLSTNRTFVDTYLVYKGTSYVLQIDRATSGHLSQFFSE